MVQKVHQVVWIQADHFAKIAEISAQTNKAPNVVISELVARALSEAGSTWEPIVTKIEEKQVVQKRYICSKCLQEFNNLQEARRHTCEKPQKEVSA